MKLGADKTNLCVKHASNGGLGYAPPKKCQIQCVVGAFWSGFGTY